MFVCPVQKISQVIMKWRRRASHLGRSIYFVEQRPPSFKSGRFTFRHNFRRATQLGKFTLWNNGRRAKQPGLMHTAGAAHIF